MLRIILLLLAVAILIVIGLFALGVFHLNPSSEGGVRIETRDVEVGTTERNVTVPEIRVQDSQPANAQ